MHHDIIFGKGKRLINEDYITSFESNKYKKGFIVCDGVSANKFGLSAAKITAKSIQKHLHTEPHIQMQTVLDALNSAEINLDSFKRTHPQATTMATTLAMLTIEKNNQLISWVGDSRIYHFRAGAPLFISEDHTLDKALGSEYQKFRNVLTKAVTGTRDYAIPDFHIIDDIFEGDYFLICSDGIHRSKNICIESIFNSTTDFESIRGRLSEHCQVNSADNFAAHLIKI